MHPLHLDRARGAALIDVVVSCAVLVVVFAITVPSWRVTRDRDATRMAARYVAQRLQMLRVDALRHNANVAMRLDPGDLGRFGAYADGDGDGVLQRDIDDGIDPALASEVHLADYFAGVSFRVVSDVSSPDGDGIIVAGSDPVRIGNTNLLSFGPMGSATSGTIYVAAGSGTQMCVRVLGATGRVRVMWFDAATRAWRRY
jgi:Tfp pilus assembly protein FimT